MNPTHQKIVTEAGGEYLGTSDGMVWLNGHSGSTMVIAEDEFSPEMVKLRLAQDASRKGTMRGAA